MTLSATASGCRLQTNSYACTHPHHIVVGWFQYRARITPSAAGAKRAKGRRRCALLLAVQQAAQGSIGGVVSRRLFILGGDLGMGFGEAAREGARRVEVVVVVEQIDGTVVVVTSCG